MYTKCCAHARWCAICRQQKLCLCYKEAEWQVSAKKPFDRFDDLREHFNSCKQHWTLFIGYSIGAIWKLDISLNEYRRVYEKSFDLYEDNLTEAFRVQGEGFFFEQIPFFDLPIPGKVVCCQESLLIRTTTIYPLDAVDFKGDIIDLDHVIASANLWQKITNKKSCIACAKDTMFNVNIKSIDNIHTCECSYTGMFDYTRKINKEEFFAPTWLFNVDYYEDKIIPFWFYK
jgi:hypothetical protein